MEYVVVTPFPEDVTEVAPSLEPTPPEEKVLVYDIADIEVHEPATIPVESS